jgi:hypothetical protein
MDLFIIPMLVGFIFAGRNVYGCRSRRFGRRAAR